MTARALGERGGVASGGAERGLDAQRETNGQRKEAAAAHHFLLRTTAAGTPTLTNWDLGVIGEPLCGGSAAVAASLAQGEGR